MRQQPPLAAAAQQVKDGVEDLAQVRHRPPGALWLGQKRLQQGELFVRKVGVIALGSHNPLYGPNFEFSHRHLGFAGIC